YQAIDNLGAVSFADQVRSDGLLARLRFLPRRPRGTRSVPRLTLDDIIDDSAVNLLKLDVEGMEFECLAGAQSLLRRCKPVVYLEQLGTADLPRVYDLMSQYGYTCYWLETHPFSRTNFRGV